MNIGLHVNQLYDRGNSTVTYDYAAAIRDILGHTPIIVSSRKKSTCPLHMFSEFCCELYDDHAELPAIIDRKRIDVLYMSKAGNLDDVTPSNCKTAIHCVFDMREPHGTVYAGVSEWLAAHFQQPLWVPHIIDLKKTDETLHADLDIPAGAFVLGRLGGYAQFDIPFVKSAVEAAINARSDLWAIFLNTAPFMTHERVKFIPYQPSSSYKSKFINTCDAMIHGRSDGETFGLAVGEFSSFNKPVLTYDAPYWWYMRSHLHILGDKAIKYKDQEELTAYLLQIDKQYVSNVEWDCYSKQYSPTNVITKFNDVFIK